MEKTVLKVDSMHCGGCVSTVEKAAMKVDGVTSVKTNLKTKLIDVSGTADTEALISSISETGYKAELASSATKEKKSLFQRLFKG